MIADAGDSLIDLMGSTRGEVHARPGGRPFNAARATARLGRHTRSPGRFSTDPLGRLLTDRLTQAGVELILPEPVQKPTALAHRRRHRSSSLTAQRGRSPNGTDNS